MQIRRVNHAGRWYTVYLQDWGADCGPTCVAMAKLALTGVDADIEWLRKKSRRALVSPGIASRIQTLGLESRDTGTNTIDLVTLAHGVGLKATYQSLNSFHLLERLKKTSRDTVAIVHVAWTGGGGHFVVVPHVSEAGTVVVLDPYYGLQATNAAPSYRFADGHGNAVSGRFSGAVIEVSI